MAVAVGGVALCWLKRCEAVIARRVDKVKVRGVSAPETVKAHGGNRTPERGLKVEIFTSFQSAIT